MQTLSKHVAVVVKSADREGLPYFTVGLVGRYNDSIEFPTLEQAQSAAEASITGRITDRIAWVRNAELDTWSGLVMCPAESFDCGLKVCPHSAT